MGKHQKKVKPIRSSEGGLKVGKGAVLRFFLVGEGGGKDKTDTFVRINEGVKFIIHEKMWHFSLSKKKNLKFFL